VPDELFQPAAVSGIDHLGRSSLKSPQSLLEPTVRKSVRPARPWRANRAWRRWWTQRFSRFLAAGNE